MINRIAHAQVHALCARFADSHSAVPTALLGVEGSVAGDEDWRCYDLILVHGWVGRVASRLDAHAHTLAAIGSNPL